MGAIEVPSRGFERNDIEQDRKTLNESRYDSELTLGTVGLVTVLLRDPGQNRVGTSKGSNWGTMMVQNLEWNGTANVYYCKKRET